MICSYCKKKGILQKSVVAEPPPSHPPLHQRSNKASQHNIIVDDTQIAQEPSEYSLFTVNTCVNGNGSDSNLFTVSMLINKQPVGM